MDQSKQSSTEPDSFTTIADSKVARNVALSLAGLATAATAVHSIWDEYYHKLIKSGPFRERREDRNFINDVAETRAVLPKEHSWHIDASEMRAMKQKAEQDYRKAVGAYLEKIEISDKFLKGTFDRAKSLGAYNIMPIVMKTGASLAVTVGGYYLINQNVRMRANNKHQDEQLRRLGNRIDAQTDRQVALYERASALADKDAGITR